MTAHNLLRHVFWSRWTFLYAPLAILAMPLVAWLLYEPIAVSCATSQDHRRLRPRHGAPPLQQARVENGFFRYKLVLGGGLKARNSTAQAREAMIGCDILNRMAKLGRPESYVVVS